MGLQATSTTATVNAKPGIQKTARERPRRLSDNERYLP
jgi:hypothetical protein